MSDAQQPTGGEDPTVCRPETPEERESTTRAAGPAAASRRSGQSGGHTGAGTAAALGLEPGRVVAGRYTVLEVLGAGGMGLVLAAYDAKLDRRVALKLMHQRQGGTDRDNDTLGLRMVREAQAMAKLSHPNVVAVYDTGTLEDGNLFIAMEMVQGQTLRGWLLQEPRGWRQVLKVYVEAGRGLAAAHAVGLVHRDFKPDNVLVGQDGRVRVTDFGVARTELSSELPAPEEAPPPSPVKPETWETPLTVPGTVVGTPRYLAPELLQGSAADARSDLFAFCVALYEALYGQPAFTGADALERTRARLEGRVTPPPERTEVPEWVGRRVLSGLRADPAQRPATLAELLTALEEDPEARRRARRGALAVAAVVLLLGGGAVSGWMRAQPTGGCERVPQRLEGVWDERVRTQLREALLGTNRPNAEATLQRVTARLDRYAGQWVERRQQACEAARGQPETSLAALQELCLERRRGQLRALTTLLAQGPDAQVLAKADGAVRSLPELESCSEAETLTAEVVPPEDPAVRERVEALHRELDEVAALHLAGKYAAGLERAQAPIKEARAVDYLPVQARALHLEGRLRQGAGDYKGAEQVLREALPVAARARDDLLVARLWVLMLDLVGNNQGRVDDALQLRLAAETAVERTGDTLVRGGLHNNLGNLFLQSSRYEEALGQYERALVLKEKALGPEDSDVAASLANVGIASQYLGRYEASLKQQERALALMEKAHGPEHPTVATLADNLGMLLFLHLGRNEEGLRRYEQAMAVREKLLGAEHPSVAKSLENVGEALTVLGRHEEAQAKLERALAIRSKALGPEHRDTASTFASLGDTLFLRGRYAEALARFEQARPLYQKVLGPEHSLVAILDNNQGSLLVEMGRYEEARVMLERSLALRKKLRGPEHVSLAFPLDSLGQLLVRRGRYEEARAKLEQALALREKALGPEHRLLGQTLLVLGELHLAKSQPAQARPLLEKALSRLQGNTREDARFALARALWASETERPRALALATQAHMYYQRLAHGPRLDELSRWLRDRASK
jgi:serine/threonine-protein kinase